LSKMCCRPFAASFSTMIEQHNFTAEGFMGNSLGGGESLCFQTDDCCLVTALRKYLVASSP
jgi:hypothetical protein